MAGRSRRSRLSNRCSPRAQHARWGLDRRRRGLSHSLHSLVIVMELAATRKTHDSGLTALYYSVGGFSWELAIASYLPNIPGLTWMCQNPNVRVQSYIPAECVNVNDFQSACNPEFIAVAVENAVLPVTPNVESALWQVAQALARWDTDGSFISVYMLPRDAVTVQIDAPTQVRQAPLQSDEPLLEILKGQIARRRETD